jgi:hypothetical protein
MVMVVAMPLCVDMSVSLRGCRAMIGVKMGTIVRQSRLSSALDMARPYECFDLGPRNEQISEMSW